MQPAYPWTLEEQQALTPGTPLIALADPDHPDERFVLFTLITQRSDKPDLTCAIVRYPDGSYAGYSWRALKPISALGPRHAEPEKPKSKPEPVPEPISRPKQTSGYNTSFSVYDPCGDMECDRLEKGS
jgi:hypothetical protein